MISPTLDVDLDYPTAGLRRDVTDEERQSYERDGAAVLRGVLPEVWVDHLREGVIRLMERSDSSSQNYADDGDPRFFAQAFPWLLDDAFKAFALYGPLKDVARQVMAPTSTVTFFYDQIFAKEPGASKATPWHQDFPFLPVSGERILRIWLPLDPVSADGGAVQYLKGSHRWGVVYHPIGFKAIPEITSAYVESPYHDPPDFEAEYDNHDWLIGEAEPGDVLLHHPLTVHGSPGNTTGRFRRAVTSMYTGDGVRWNPHPANMFRNKSLTGHVEMPELEPGGPIECPLFPRVWPEVQVASQ